MTDWKYYIEENICKPINSALNGIDLEVPEDGSRLKLGGKIWYVKDKNDNGELLFDLLKPYLEEFLFEPQRRMSDEYVNNETKPLFWKCKATVTLKEYINTMFHARPLFEGKNIICVVDRWIDDYYNGYKRKNLHFDLLIQAIQEGLCINWSEIKEYVASELVNCPSDYDKIRLEYYCFLDAIIKISVNEQITDEQRKDWYSKLRTHWDMLSLIYSVMTGHIINSGHNHFSPIISPFRGYKKEYASLMVAALRHHPQVLEQGRAKQIAKEVETSMKTIKQNTDLHDLCACLFPSKHWEEYNLNAPHMSTAEMWNRIEYLESELNNSNNRQQDQQKLEMAADYLKEQLGKSISMDELANAILKCPPVMANLIFTQLDLRLEDVCKVWTEYRKDLKKRVLALEMADSNTLNDTFAKVSAIEEKPYTVNHNYGNGAVHDDHSKNLLVNGTNNSETPLLLNEKV